LSLSNSSSSVDAAFNIVNASISTNQTSSLSLSNSSSSVDFQLSDAAAKISSTSARIISLSSQSSRAATDVSSGETIRGYRDDIEDPYRLVRQYLSALELDYSDSLSAELSDKRILNRLDELEGLVRGVIRAEEITSKIGEIREYLLSDRRRAATVPRISTDGASGGEDLRAAILRAIQERFGAYDPSPFLDAARYLPPALPSLAPKTETQQQDQTTQTTNPLRTNQAYRTEAPKTTDTTPSTDPDPPLGKKT
jgi:hypothetical protein